jgi:hypothetical protein
MRLFRYGYRNMAFRKMPLTPWWNKITKLTLLSHLKVEEIEITEELPQSSSNN